MNVVCMHAFVYVYASSVPTGGYTKGKMIVSSLRRMG